MQLIGGAAVRGCWVIAEDGVIDEVAIVVAATGGRPVALTPTERRLAAAALLASGFPAAELARRLHMRKADALTLARQICPAWPLRRREPAAS